MTQRKVSKESIKTPPISDNTFALKVIDSNWLEKFIFNGNCLIQEKIYFIHDSTVNLYITFELDTWSRDLNWDNCLVGAMKLTRSVNPDKYGYNGYGLDLKHVQNIHGGVVNGVKTLLFLGWWFLSFSVHFGNRNKNVLVLGALFYNNIRRLDDSIS